MPRLDDMTLEELEKELHKLSDVEEVLIEKRNSDRDRKHEDIPVQDVPVQVAYQKRKAELEEGGIEFAGFKFGGAKAVALLTALSSLGGATWAGFEFYNDYRNMKAQIESYVAPDLSNINQELAVQKETMVALEKAQALTSANLKALNDELTMDLDRIEQLSRRVDDTTAETQRELRDDVYEIEQKVNDRLREIDNDIRTVRKELEEKIQLILDNPLNN